MKKADIERSYHQGHHGDPMINVKHHLWVPDLIRRWRDDGHEFSGDRGFWAWLDELWEHSDYDALNQADERAREDCWEDAQGTADLAWPNRKVKVWSAGRSAGWLVVDGLPDVDDWDAIAVGRWALFAKAIRCIVDDEYPYSFIWHLHVNVWESIRDDRANTYPAPIYQEAT